MRISCSIVRPASALLWPAGAAAHADVVVRVANSYVPRPRSLVRPGIGLMQLNSPGASGRGHAHAARHGQRIRAGNSAWNFYTPSDTPSPRIPDGMKSALNFYDPRQHLPGQLRQHYAAANNQLVHTAGRRVADSVLVKPRLPLDRRARYKTVPNPTPGGADVLDGFYVPTREQPQRRRRTGSNQYIANTAAGGSSTSTRVNAATRRHWASSYRVMRLDQPVGADPAAHYTDASPSPIGDARNALPHAGGRRLYRVKYCCHPPARVADVLVGADAGDAVAVVPRVRGRRSRRARRRPRAWDRTVLYRGT